MTKNLERAHYNVSYEKGRLTRRGTKRIGGHEVKIINYYFNLPEDAWNGAEQRLHVEIAKATGSDAESVRRKLLENYNRACAIIVENAKMGIFTHVPVEPISYTVDPRRLPIQIENSPIMSSLN